MITKSEIHTKTNKKTKTFKKKSFPYLYICLNILSSNEYIDKQCHGITFDKDKNKEIDKDNVSERPNTCYIF